MVFANFDGHFGAGANVISSSAGPLTVSSGVSLLVDATHPSGGTVGSASFATTINGTVAASGGKTIVVTGSSVTNFSGTTLTGGTWQAYANSTLRIPSAINTDAANILLDGANSNIYVGASGTTDALSGLVTISSGGAFSILNSRNYTTSASAGASVSVPGTLTIGNNSTFAVGGTNAYTQAGTLNLQLGGAAVGQYSRLNVGGLATFSVGSTLNVSAVNSYVPAFYTIFTPISHGSVSGIFTNTNMNLGAGVSVIPWYASAVATKLIAVPTGTTVAWIGSNGADWSTGTNWSTGSVPGTSAVVYIGGNALATHTTGTHTVASLCIESGSTVNFTSGFITVSNGQVTLDGTLTINGGTAFTVGDVTHNGLLGGNGTVVFGSAGGSSISFYGAPATIGSGITIRGQHGSVTPASAGVIVNNNGIIQADVPDGTSGGITVRFIGNAGDGLNAGTIKAISGGTITAGGSAGSFTNTGTLSADGTGSTLSISTSGTNAAGWSSPNGIIQVTNNATLNLGGQFTQADFAHFSRTPGTTVTLTGRLNGDLTLNDTLGGWYLRNGTLYNGVFSIQSGSAATTKLMTPFPGGTLDHYTLNSPIDLTNFDGTNQARIDVVDGLTLNTTWNIGTADTSMWATVNFVNGGINNTFSQTVNGTGVFNFGGSTLNGITTLNTLLTFGPNITIQGKNGTVGSSASIANQGQILANVSGGTLNINLGRNTASNTGTIQASNGANLNFTAGYSDGHSFANAGTIGISGGGTLNINTGNTNVAWSSSAGTINVDSSTLNFGGAFDASAGIGTWSRTAGTVNVSAAITNTGNNLTLTPTTTGSWNLGSGSSITGGTVSSSGGAQISANSTGTVTFNSVTIGASVTNTTSGTLNLNGTWSISTAGGVTNADGGTINFNGTYSNSGAITQNGSGTINLGGTPIGSTFGTLTQSGGTLNLNTAFNEFHHNHHRDEFNVADVQSILIHALDGNDRVYIGSHVTTPTTIDGGAGNDWIHGGSGNDTITDPSGDNKIHAGKGDDVITVGAGDNKIWTDGGNDRITAGDGDNQIHAGQGNNVIIVGNGDNKIWTDGGNDSITAGDGDNEIHAGGACDTIIVGNGNNRIWTAGGSDSIHTGDGNNEIHAGHGDDIIVTGRGNDKIWTDGGNDYINAGDGNNEIHAGNGNNNIIAGVGNDLIWAGNGNDVINAGDGDNEIRAGAGNNVITVGSGNDKIWTEGGNDVINAGNGNNEVHAGAGNDTVTTGSGADLIYGEAGDDLVRPGLGNDEVHGGAGNDILLGGDGNDMLVGDAGRDLLIGGFGSDQLVGNADEDVLIDGTTAYDTSNAALAAIMSVWTGDGGYQARVNTLSNADAVYHLAGDHSAGQTVFADTSVDQLTGCQSQDWFFANREADNGGAVDQVTDKTSNEAWSDTDL